MVASEEILQRAAKAVVECDVAAAEAVAYEALAAGLDPVTVINQGLSAGMARASDLFDRGEMFVPELIVASEAMVKAIKILETAMPVQEKRKLGTVVIGTIEGDVHDIGKGIVATMLRVYGFEVHDLGRDVPIRAFVEKAKEVGADVVAASALMTTTQPGQKVLIEALRKEGLDVRTAIGGAVATQRWADKIGADIYAENALEAVVKFKEVLLK